MRQETQRGNPSCGRQLKSRFLAGAAVVYLSVAFASGISAKPPRIDSFPIEVEAPHLKLEPAPDYPPIKEIGGIRIELIPVPPKTRKMKLVTLEARTGIADFLSENMKSVWVYETPFFQIYPENLQFQVRVTNKLPKVLRLQGVAIQFAVNGKSVPTDYALNDIQNTILLPNQTWEGLLHGPPANSLESSGVLLAGIYDVITEVDEANSPTKRSNFEWIYAYTVVKTKESLQKIRYKSAVTLEQAKSLHNSRHVVEE